MARLSLAASILLTLMFTSVMPRGARAEGQGGSGPATRPARPSVTDQFGKVVALTIQSPDMWLDFDRAATTRPAAEVARRDNDAEFGLRWFRDQGIDAAVSHVLEGIDIEGICLSDADWGNMTPPQLVERLARGPCLPVKMAGPIPVTYMDPIKTGTTTFGLRTREGSVVILQLDMPAQRGQWPVVRMRSAAPVNPIVK